MNIVIIVIISLLVFVLFACYLRRGTISYERPDTELVPVEPQVCGGDYFRVVKDIKVTGLTSWGGPYTGSFECILPAGTILNVATDSVPWAEGFVVIPQDYSELEIKLVPESERTAKNYGGYYFSFLKSDIGKIIVKSKLPNLAATHRR